MTSDFPLNIPGVQIEPIGNDSWLIEQEGNGQTDRVALHPLHIRLLAELAGLVPTSDLAAAKTIATLARRLRVLHQRIEQMDGWLRTCSDTTHADLDWEITHSGATLAIADEFIADLDDLVPGPHPSAGKPMANGGVSNGKPMADAIAVKSAGTATTAAPKGQLELKA